jgi:hypothetical protein
MFLWFAAGFLLAAFVVRQLHRKTSVEETQSESKPWVALVAIGLALLQRSRSKKPSQSHNDGEIDQPPTEAIDVRPFFIAISISALILAFFLAALVDHASSGERNGWISELIFWIQSVYLGSRFYAFFWGAVCGTFLQIFIEPIWEGAARLFDATLGNHETTAWALQATLALFIIAGAIFLIKPDLLAYIRSIEYGSLKATFSEHSSTTKVANLSYKQLLADFVSVKEYQHYFDEFLKPESLRSIAETSVKVRELSDDQNTTLTENRRSLVGKLYPAYMGPVITVLECLERNHALDAAAHDPSLFAYFHQWETFLTLIRSGEPEPLSPAIATFLAGVERSIAAAQDRAAQMIPECGRRAEVVNKDASAKAIEDIVVRSRNLINVANRKDAALILIVHPYLISALGDLIAILTDQRQKAEFLTRTLEEFHTSDDMLTPGMINIFYQLANAKLRSESWPEESILGNLDYSLKGIRLMVDRGARGVASEQASKKTTDGKNKSGTTKDDDSPDLMIVRLGMRNLFILLSDKLAVYNQQALAGNRLPDAARQDWLLTYSSVIQLARALSEAPGSVIETGSVEQLDDLYRKELRAADITPEYRLDSSIALSMSSILIEESTGHVTTTGCNSARYFERRAVVHMEDLLNTGYVAQKSKNAAVTGQRLKKILSVISNHIAAACDGERTGATEIIIGNK